MPKEKQPVNNITEEGETPQILPSGSLLSNQQAKWDRLYCGFHYQSANGTRECSSTRHVVVVHTEVPLNACSERKMAGAIEQEQLRTGDIVVVPANTAHWTHSDREQSYILLNLEPTLLAHAAYESVAPERVELLPHFAMPDPLVHQIGLALKSELASDGLGNRLFVDSLSTALSIHLLRHYCVQKHRTPEYMVGLPKYVLQQVLDYIHEHLKQDLSILELASVALMSQHHFSRMFKQSMGLSPYQYVIRCRIEAAKRLLARRELSIAQISYRMGFASHSQFTIFFRKHTHLTPKAYRQGL